MRTLFFFIVLCTLLARPAGAAVVFESNFNNLSANTITEWQDTATNWRCLSAGCDFFWNLGLYGMMNLQSQIKMGPTGHAPVWRAKGNEDRGQAYVLFKDGAPVNSRSGMSWTNGFDELYVRIWNYYTGDDGTYQFSTGGKHMRISSADAAGNIAFNPVMIPQNNDSDNANEGISIRNNGPGSMANDWGAKYSRNFAIPNNRWVCYEWYWKMNDPGVANGVTRFWVDQNDGNGPRMEIEKTDILMVPAGHPAYKMNSVLVGGWWSNSGNASYQNNYRYMDDLVISTTRVGCGGAPVCEPSCAGRVCGPDGCGGSCAPGCSGPDSCVDGQCVSCIPDWQCSDWSEGSCGTRSCTDDNACGTGSGKPTEELVCGPACGDCSCSPVVDIFTESLQGAIPAEDPLSVVPEGYSGAGLRIDGESAWVNTRIGGMALDVSAVHWPEAALEFHLKSEVAVDYVAVNLFSELGQAAEVSFSTSGDGAYQKVSIPLTSFVFTQEAFGMNLTRFMIGANWQGTEAFIDEIRIVCPTPAAGDGGLADSGLADARPADSRVPGDAGPGDTGTVEQPSEGCRCQVAHPGWTVPLGIILVLLPLGLRRRARRR